MTDSEIIKALESKYKTAIDGYYTHLQYGGKGDEHEEKYLEEFGNVLDLINRQRAEIDKRKEESVRLRKVQTQLDDMCKMYHVIRAEAIKEFAEKSKEIVAYLVELLFRDEVEQCKIEDCDKPDSISCGSEICVRENRQFWYEKFDNLVKEMVGE